MKNRIKQITIITQQGVGITEVGNNDIAEINDRSQEYPDHSEFIFEARDKNGKLLKQIINCPVEILYFKEASK